MIFEMMEKKMQKKLIKINLKKKEEEEFQLFAFNNTN